MRGFSHYYKYTLGHESRNGGRETVALIIKVNSAEERLSVLQELRDAIEKVKVTARICQEVKWFMSFDPYVVTVEVLVMITRQNEGWLAGVPFQRFYHTMHSEQKEEKRCWT